MGGVRGFQGSAPGCDDWIMRGARALVILIAVFLTVFGPLGVADSQSPDRRNAVVSLSIDGVVDPFVANYVRDQIGSPYHEAMELVPRLVIGALLANTSLSWAQLAIDANNALCQGIGQVSLPAWEHADSTTQSASSLRVAILDAVNSPSFSGVATSGGVNTRAGSAKPSSSPDTSPWVAKAITL